MRAKLLCGYVGGQFHPEFVNLTLCELLGLLQSAHWFLHMPRRSELIFASNFRKKAAKILITSTLSPERFWRWTKMSGIRPTS